MKRRPSPGTILKTAVAVLLSLSLSNCSVGTRIDGTFTPADGATDVALDAAVQVVFSGVIAEPPDWASVFTLTAEGSTANACTSITYDSATLTATCNHEDFDPATVYMGTLTGVIGYTPTSTFTTTGGSLSVTSVSKTSVATATDGEGAIDIAYTFNTAPTTVPTLAVTGEGSPVAGTCTVDPADATVYTCPVTGLAGCTSIVDYTATLSSPEMSADYVFIFDSADDEFENPATRTACWNLQRDESCGNNTAYTIGDGILAIHIDSTGCDKNMHASFYKGGTSTVGFTNAFSFATSLLTTNAGGAAQETIYTGAAEDGVEDNEFEISSGNIPAFGSLWFVEGKNTDGVGGIYSAESTYLNVAAPLVECIVMDAPAGTYLTAKAYPAFPDIDIPVAYKTLTLDNMIVFFDTVTLIPNMSIAWEKTDIKIEGLADGVDLSFDTTMDYIRFSRAPAGGFTGTSSDCPPLD